MFVNVFEKIVLLSPLFVYQEFTIAVVNTKWNDECEQALFTCMYTSILSECKVHVVMIFAKTITLLKRCSNYTISWNMCKSPGSGAMFSESH